MVFQINVLTILVMAALGGICAYLANRNIAVFHDGLRPIYPQYLNGYMDRKTLFATSAALSIGLVLGFGISTSIAGGIIVAHTIMLSCDMIGAAFPDTKEIYKWISAALGAALGVVLMFGMQGIVMLFAWMPIDFLPHLATVGSLIIITFCVFPAIAVAYQSGAKAGMLVLALTMLVRQLTVLFGQFTIGEVNVALNADGMALLFSITAMVIAAIRYSKKTTGSATQAFAGFGDNVARIKKNIVILSISGGIVALATTLLLIAEGPASLVLTAEGNYTEAGLIALGRAIGFIPLVMTTAIVSGLYSPAGTKMVHVPAIFLINFGIMGLVGSFFIGVLIMAIEVLFIGMVAKGLDRFPGMKELGDNIRTSMSKVLDLALLMGGALAANAIAPTLGYVWIFGLYFLNQTAKKPVPTMAIGPIGAIALGIIVNILHVLQLFPV